MLPRKGLFLKGLLCVGVAGLILIPGNILATPIVMGYVSEFGGDVNIERGGNFISAFNNMEIFSEDTIHTSTSSSVKIADFSGDTYEISSSSALKLYLAIKKKEKEKKLRLLKLLKGKVRSKVKKLKPGDEFKVQTRTCASGVRGTDFSFLYDDVSGVSYIEVFEGMVEGARVDLELLPDRYFYTPSVKDLISFNPSAVWMEVDENNSYLNLVCTGTIGTLSEGESGHCPIPEPSTIFLFGFCLLGIAGASRKKTA